jgi:hypothetical protein
MGVHQAKHLLRRRPPIRDNRFHQKVSDKSVQCGLMALSVLAPGFKDLFI